MISKATLKSIKALKLKKYRSKEGKFLVEGIKCVNEVLEEGWEIELLLATEHSAQELLSRDAVHVVDQKTLQTLSQLATNEDCIAVVKMKNLGVNDLINLGGPVIILDGIQDPGNLGTIIRTLDWFGYNQVVCSSDTVDLYNVKTISATMGSFTRVNVYYTDVMQLIERSRLPVYGMDMNGKDIQTAKLRTPAFYLLGSESRGIRPELRTKVTETIKIAGEGKAESLNVGISAAILLYKLSTI